MVLKGVNLELYEGTADSIWRDWDDHRDDVIRLLDEAQALGVNTVRLTFPDAGGEHGETTEGDLERLPDLLGDLGDALDLLEARGMGAIVTLFNRHDYPGAYQDDTKRWRDRTKTLRFAERFGEDPRVLMWDLANEPPLGNEETRTATVLWLEEIRDVLTAHPVRQPITVGMVNHYEARMVEHLGEIISFHCYGRFDRTSVERSGSETHDGVKYYVGTYCGASVEYLRNELGRRPIVLQEFGWPDAPSRWNSGGRPPEHPWGLWSYPEDAETMDHFYREVLDQMAVRDVAGAVAWTIQDADAHHFGLLDEDYRRKREASDHSAYTIFRAWGDERARPFRWTEGEPAPDPGCPAGERRVEDGRCLPRCGGAGGDSCFEAPGAECHGYPQLDSWDCDVCCRRAGETPAPDCPEGQVRSEDGRCLPSCGDAGGTVCAAAGDPYGQCAGRTNLESWDCPVCCDGGETPDLPSCGDAGGNVCAAAGDPWGQCTGRALLESWDCPVCCHVDAAPAPVPTCGAAGGDTCAEPGGLCVGYAPIASSDCPVCCRRAGVAPPGGGDDPEDVADDIGDEEVSTPNLLGLSLAQGSPDFGEQLPLAKAMGATLVRVQLCDPDAAAAEVRPAFEAGLHVAVQTNMCLVPELTPADWHRPREGRSLDEGNEFTARYAERFGRLVHAVEAERARHRGVRAFYEVWNEPNEPRSADGTYVPGVGEACPDVGWWESQGDWRDPGGGPPRIKTLCPQVFGALAVATWYAVPADVRDRLVAANVVMNGTHDAGGRRWFEALLDVGSLRWFRTHERDLAGGGAAPLVPWGAFGVHPYGYDTERADGENALGAVLRAYRRRVPLVFLDGSVVADYTPRPIAVTETGWETEPVDPYRFAPWPGDGVRVDYGARLRGTLARASEVGTLYTLWYNLRDGGGEAYGLQDAGGAWKEGAGTNLGRVFCAAAGVGDEACPATPGVEAPEPEPEPEPEPAPPGPPAESGLPVHGADLRFTAPIAQTGAWIIHCAGDGRMGVWQVRDDGASAAWRWGDDAGGRDCGAPGTNGRHPLVFMDGPASFPRVWVTACRADGRRDVWEMTGGAQGPYRWPEPAPECG